MSFFNKHRANKLEVEEVTRYAVEGKLFRTEQEAIDYREELVSQFVKKMLHETGADKYYSSVIPVTEFLLNNRQEIINLLN